MTRAPHAPAHTPALAALLAAAAALALPAAAQEAPAPLSDYVVYGCRDGGTALTPYVFHRASDGALSALTGEGIGDLTDGGRILEVTEPEAGTVIVTRGTTTIRFTDTQRTTLGPTGGSRATDCLRLDTAFLAALGAVADDGLARGMVDDEIATLQRDHLQRQTAAAEEAAAAARATEAREEARTARRPTVETWHIGGGAPQGFDSGAEWSDSDLLTAYILSNRRLLRDAPIDRDLRRDLDRLYDRMRRDYDRHGRAWPRD
ncbi:hypothetical protein [Frigidibacter sp. MR17.24]|uniref:hypothetical protein n=1 Tax=Frigidibacter sp. MR17.24 TaxID=3127345 RepID=UPI003012AD85